ncbi:hypothetical protein [Maribacter sp. 2-571]|uniref:hypothetical protein n=1 Tax=Maribacter sp. 2-571 TaxID=3417569 RepID=UPI003D3387F0
MSNGNPKKLKLAKALLETTLLTEATLPENEGQTRVYRKKNSRVKKALNFETGKNKSKLG